MFGSGLEGVRVAVVAEARACEPGAMGRDEAISVLRSWTAIANAASAAVALVSARIGELGPPPSAGAASAADFIAREMRTTSARAATRIKTGQGLGDAGATRERATSGELSSEQAEAIADAVAAAPAAEGALLDAAGRGSLRELRGECAKRKAAADPDPEAARARIHRNRRLRRWADADGTEHLHASGTRECMALVDQAIREKTDETFRGARAEGVREPLEAYAFDALVGIATDASGSSSGEKRGRRRSRFLGVIRADLESLVRGSVEGDETCEIAGLGPISVLSARDLLGESILKLVITDGSAVRNVTHLGRGASGAQKVALLWEQPVCTREGCGRHFRLEDDHRDEWAKVKVTELVNLDRLCDPDHWLKTHKGWALVEGTGVRPMVPPDDPRHPRLKASGRPPPRAAAS